jgi:regulator of replication initiation timing
MNQYEFIIALVFIVGVISILRSRLGVRHVTDRTAEHSTENARLRDEVKELKDRLKVLERITVEKENSLSAEIESLRDR